MITTTTDSHAAWRADQLEADKRWILELDEKARRDLVAGVDKALEPEKSLFDYRRQDFNLGSAWPVLAAALEETRRGGGVSIVRGLPRADMDEKRFELLTWAIGLHAGVPRPQGKATQYISAVRDAGTAYRSGTGRGYSSNAELDFHTDSSDIVFLSCYNKAVSGGMSITTSTREAYKVMASEHPDLLEYLHRPIHFSRQGEEAPDEEATCVQPIFDEADGRLFSRWNWNRVNSAQQLAGVPQLSAKQREALERFDEMCAGPALRTRCGSSPVMCRSSTVT